MPHADASMPSTGVNWLDAVILAATVFAALGGALKVFLDHVAPLFRGLHNFLDDWAGEPARPGFTGRTGVMSRLSQLENNGGSSVKDAVDRIESTVAQNSTRLVEHIEQATALIEQGVDDKRHILAELERLSQANADLAEAMPIVAASHPPEEKE